MLKQSAEIHNDDSRFCGIYVHIPFCLKKCPYCSFFSTAGKSSTFERYARAVLKQLQGFSQDDPVETIFFGGGTPTMLPVSLLTEILSECRQDFTLAPDPEISIEVNPATVTEDDLITLQREGFNRISIGAQSLNDIDLDILGRPHNSEDVEQTVALAKKAGFANLSLDLMYGLPGQTVLQWENVLNRALDLEPSHLSIYELTIEPGTVFDGRHKSGKLKLPEEDQVLQMMEVTLEEVSRKNYHRYEISNYALPGMECRHNTNYWNNGSYIGIGAGAVSSLCGTRTKAVEDVDEYCMRVESGNDPWISRESLANEERFRETVVMGLRMTGGISVSELQKRFGIELHQYYGDILPGLIEQGMIIHDNDRVRLSAAGLFLANSIMAELV